MRRAGWILPGLLAAVVALSSAGVLVPVAAAPDAKDLKSRDVALRLAAVESVRKEGGADAESLLLSMLGDADGEVVEKAALALSERGSAASVGPLVDLALTGSARRVRLAAVATLGALDAAAAGKAIAKKSAGPEGLAATEALARLGPALVEDAARKALDRALKSKEPDFRAAAAPGVLLLPADQRLDRVKKLLEDPDVMVVCATIDAMRAAPDPAWIPLLVDLIGPEGVPEVVERRIVAAVRAAVATKPPGPETLALSAPVLAAPGKTTTGGPLRPLARLIGSLGAAPPVPPPPEPGASADPKPPPPPADGGAAPPPAAAPEPPPPAVPLVPAADAVKALEYCLWSKGEGTRAVAAQALGRIRSEEALAKLVLLAAGDLSPQVRAAAFRALLAVRGLAHEKTLELVLRALSSDKDVGVREQAATALGVEGLTSAFSGLEAALADPDWGVVTCAAVSLGKTRDPRGVEPLARLLGKKVKDWRLRGAALTGLGHLRVGAAVPHLIEGLLEREPAVARTAYEFLRRMTPKEIAPEADKWREWWAGIGPKYEFVDAAKAAKEAQKGGYAPTLIGVYEKLDVVVLQSRGDHIEDMLKHLGVEHRITRAAGITKAALHPFCLFVSNCTGEVQEEDVARLQWFVRVGGYLFGSCWALHHTIEPVWPGYMKKLPTKAEVLDEVLALPCPVESPFFEGVFPSFTRPIYVLYGSHLIEVLRPEAVEVLIDSPEAASRWGGGNMAAWFQAGHGVILDSANHFNLQGLERVTGLKTAQDRIAYSVDHKGLDWGDVRKLADEKVWDSQAKSVEKVRDLSAFKFITNFVRQKRKADL